MDQISRILFSCGDALDARQLAARVRRLWGAGPSGLAELLSEWAGLPGKRSYSWAGRPVGHEGLGAHAFGRGSFPGAGFWKQRHFALTISR